MAPSLEKMTAGSTSGAVGQVVSGMEARLIDLEVRVGTADPERRVPKRRAWKKWTVLM